MKKDTFALTACFLALMLVFNPAFAQTEPDTEAVLTEEVVQMIDLQENEVADWRHAPADAASNEPFATQRDNVSYAVGLNIAVLHEEVAQDIDLAILRRAVEHALAEKPPLLAAEEAESTQQALIAVVTARNGEPVPGMVPGSVPPAPDKEKVSQMFGGYFIGPMLFSIKDDIDLNIVFQALQAIFTGERPRFNLNYAQDVLNTFSEAKQAEHEAKQAEMAQRNRSEGLAFLERNRSQPGVVTTASGLQYQILRPGSGPRPAAESQVMVHYEGRLLDGTIFDSSYRRGEPTTFALNGVIAGWTEGVGLMPRGAKYRFWIPAELAYGEQGAGGGQIGPNATLSFDVELIDIERSR